MEKEEYKETVHLKLAKRHPKNAFRIHSIVVEGYVYKPYEIDAKIAKDLLKDPGVKAWVKCKEVEEDQAEDHSEESDIVDPSEEEIAAAQAAAEAAKGQDEVAANAPAPSEAPAESQEAAPELIDETQVIEDKPKKGKNK